MNRFSKLTMLALSTAVFAGMGVTCKSPVDPRAEKDFRGRLGHTTITVYPTVLRGPALRFDDASQGRLAVWFTDAELATMTQSTTQIQVPDKAGSNQSWLWRASAAAFAEHVRKHPPQSDYAMMAEYLLDRDDAPIGIHLYVATAKGVLAYGVGLNSHHKVFNERKPKSVDDATTVLIEHLRGDLEADEAAH
jgi:hypothetical protein